MTSTLYKRGSQYGEAELYINFSAMFEAGDEAEAAFPEFKQFIHKAIPEKLFWQPSTSELFLWDIDNPMTDDDDAAFDWDQIIIGASDRILEKYA